MKKLMALVAAWAVFSSVCATVYSVEDLPNVQLADRTKHFVNPDNIVSASVAAQIDTLLADARRQSSAEVVAVVVDDINPSDIDDFATALFNKWGIGKSDKNNGILILVAKDSHQAVIRTGYGAEGILPDILAGRILRNQMFPRFRENDFDGGVLDGVTEVHRLVTDPDAVAELMSKQDDNWGGDGPDAFEIYLAICCLMAAVMLLVLLVKLYNGRRLTDYEKYTRLQPMRAVYLALTFAGLAIPLVASLPLVILLTYWRNKPRKCTHCGHRMNKLDEMNDNAYLTPSQDLEEQLNSVDYDVWLCPECGQTTVYPYINKSSDYSQCPRCYARAAKLTAVRELVHPTTVHEGLGQREYTCMNCHNVYQTNYKIPKKEVPVVIVGGGGRGFSGGGGSFGGGFGGGMTGGGGASGHW